MWADCNIHPPFFSTMILETLFGFKAISIQLAVVVFGSAQSVWVVQMIKLIIQLILR